MVWAERSAIDNWAGVQPPEKRSHVFVQVMLQGQQPTELAWVQTKTDQGALHDGVHDLATTCTISQGSGRGGLEAHRAGHATMAWRPKAQCMCAFTIFYVKIREVRVTHGCNVIALYQGSTLLRQDAGVRPHCFPSWQSGYQPSPRAQWLDFDMATCATWARWATWPLYPLRSTEGGTEGTIVGVDKDGDLAVFLKNGHAGATQWHRVLNASQLHSSEDYHTATSCREKRNWDPQNE